MFSQILIFATFFAACVIAFVLIVRYRLQRSPSRGLFRFSDGLRVREVDPIGVLMALESHPKFRLDLDPKRALEDGDQEAMATMADAVRIAFGVPEFTSPKRPGLTVYECVELLAVFSLYVDSQKKSTKPSPISPASTASTSTASEEPTTLNTLVSG